MSHCQVGSDSGAKYLIEILRAGGGRSDTFHYGGGPECAQDCSSNHVTLDVEETVDGTVSGNEALGLALRLKCCIFRSLRRTERFEFLERFKLLLD
jgi:hypothetical protein